VLMELQHQSVIIRVHGAGTGTCNFYPGVAVIPEVNSICF